MQKKPPHRAFLLEDALIALMETERTFAELESSGLLHAFSAKQKAAYRDALCRLRSLIHDVEQDSAQEQLAS